MLKCFNQKIVLFLTIVVVFKTNRIVLSHHTKLMGGGGGGGGTQISAWLLTDFSHRFSISFIRTTAATRRMSTLKRAETALSGRPSIMTLFQMVSRASSESTGWLLNSWLLGKG